MTAPAIVHVQPAALEQLDPTSREVAVTAYLSQARDQLALAVQATGPEAVAALKAEIATAAEATKQLGLSKEIQQDAQEMVRRAEYALNKAVRAGQDAGEIATRANNGGGPRGPYTRVRNGIEQAIQPAVQQPETGLISPRQFYSNNEEWADLNVIGEATEPEFEAALSDAKAEGNLSRANVIRKIKGVKSEGLTPVEKLVKIRELAPTGRTSGQIANEIGASEDYVRRVARENDIEITADKVLRGTHRVKVDGNHIVNHLVMSLEGLVDGLDAIDVDGLDEAQMQNWADSLTTTTRALNRFVKQIKEKTQ